MNSNNGNGITAEQLKAQMSKNTNGGFISPFSDGTTPVPNPDVVVPEATQEVKPSARVVDDIVTPDIGGGIVIENIEDTSTGDLNLTEDRISSVAAYLNDMDERIEMGKETARANGRLKKEVHVNEEGEEVTEEVLLTPEELAKQEEERANFEKEYSEAVIVIDKTNMGIIDFTDDEREKLERVKKIKVEEVESIELSAIKVKKADKGHVKKLLKRQKETLHSTPVLLPASGFTAHMTGCSTYELLELMQDTKNPLVDTQAKWTLLYNKITNASIGKFKNYNDFLQKVASADYTTLVYGVLCATYPDNDKLPLNCTKCKKEYDHPYSLKSLLRAELVSDELSQEIVEIGDASSSQDDAIEKFENSKLNTVKRYRLPESGVIADIQIQSAYDFQNQTLKKLSKNKNTKLGQASVLSTAVNQMLIEDESEEGAYISVTEPEDITDIIYHLKDTDLMILNKKIDENVSGITFEYGLMNATCPHCGNYTATIPLSVESILFFKYQQSLSTKVE